MSMPNVAEHPSANERSLRILILPSWYPTPENKVNGIFIRSQADALRQTHQVRVLYLEMLPRGHRKPPRRRVSSKRGYIEELIEVPSHPFIWRFTYLLYLLRAYLRLRRKFAPDIIHSHIALPAGWGSLMLRRLFRVPVVLTENSSNFDSWLSRMTWRLQAKQAFRGVDVVIAVGEGLRRRIAATFGAPRRMVVIPNIVDTTRFTPTPLPAHDAGYSLLFIGLLETTQKGVPFLLQALGQLKESGEMSLHVDLVGDGHLRPDYEAQARELGIATMVKFHGLQPPERIAQLLQESHALVLPSLHEALPLVIIEALASGRPVIATRCGGPEYMLDATSGLLVEPANADQLAAAIHDLISNLDYYNPQQIAAGARQYSYEAVTAALTGVYKSLIHD